MFLSNVLCKKAKSKHILVMMKSLVSGHPYNTVRERLADKLEVIRFDPWVQQEVVYREFKKVKSMSPNYKPTDRILKPITKALN